MRPAEFRHKVQQAARKVFWGDVMAEIEKEFDPQFHDLARETVIYYMAEVICDLPNESERIAAVQSIPDDCQPSHAKPLIIQGCRVVWKKNNAVRP